MIGVTENLRKIRDLLAQAAVDAGRDPGEVRLLAVSKKQPAELVLEAAAAGQREFGENQAGEGVEKIRAVADESLVWHFIGHVQSNKSRLVAEHFDWVHSVDRVKIAERLSRQRPDGRGPLNVCLQVNVDEEASKSGIAVGEVGMLADAVAALPGLRLRGLMCLPKIREDFDAQRAPFARLREVTEALRGKGFELDTLSMGMSGDFRAAVAEGATIVRIGTAVFGPRPGEE